MKGAERMRRRDRSIVEHTENHDRWLVSYADFITLLFAFFVVMYSISSVNEGKYRVLSRSLDSAFEIIDKTNKPIQIGEPAASFEPIQISTAAAQRKTDQQLTDEIIAERQRMGKISEQFEEILEPYIDKQLISVKRNDFWVELEMKSRMLFSSGEADVADSALPVLKKIAEIFREVPNVINVEGHTDNIPIDTVEFPSNWDLSAARAASVVKEFTRLGISPGRLAAVGYGEFHPIADNRVEEGRFKNRRVVLVLMSQALARYGVADSERNKLLNLNEVADRAGAGQAKP